MLIVAQIPERDTESSTPRYGVGTSRIGHPIYISWWIGTSVDGMCGEPVAHSGDYAAKSTERF